ncbi:MAG: FkbM family methyltransferase [Actinomycetota bacterium]
MTSTQLEELLHLQNETLHRLDRVKNGQAVHVGQGQVLTRLFTGQKIFLDARDISVAPALMMDGHWEVEATDLMRRLLTPSSTFLDVGANVGYFGLVAGTIVSGDRGGSIHMIEANPELVPLIFKSINVTGLLGTATVANLAITDQVGEVELQVVKDLLGSSSLFDLRSEFEADAEGRTEIGFEVDKVVTVPATTLDRYAESAGLERVDLVKLDVESYEEQAYRGMAGIIERNRAHLAVMLEFTWERTPDAEAFVASILDDFRQVKVIEHGTGRLRTITSHGELMAAMGDEEWIMVVAANRSLDV